MEISGSEIFGSPVSIPFSAQLSTLIGGRGTGKSLVLSALVRLFGADTEWLHKSEEQRLPWEARHLALFTEGGPFYGSDVRMSVVYRKESGVIYRMALEAPGDELLEHRKLEMKTPDGWQSIATGQAALGALDFRPLFFLQNQMSAITGARVDQEDLTKLIEGPIRAARASVRSELTRLSGTVRDGMNAKQRRRALENHNEQLDAQLKQKESERKAFLEAAQKGLTPEQASVFAEAESLRKGDAAIGALESAVQDQIRAVTAEQEDLQAALKSATPPVDSLLSSKLADFKSDKYVSSLLEVAATFQKNLQNLIEQTAKAFEKAIAHKPAYRKSIKSLIAKAADVAEKEKSRREAVKKAQALEPEIAELQKHIQKNKQEIQKIDRAGLIAKADESLTAYERLVKEYSEQLQRRAEDITGNEAFRLIVRIVPGGRFESVIDAMKELCGGAGVRAGTWAQLEQALAASVSPATTITELFQSIIRGHGDPTTKLPNVWNTCGFSDKVFDNVRSRTTVEQWVEISVLLAEDKVDVLYKRKGKKPIPILSASPGERAVELLKLALFSTTGPLIIDQPEDDLDNDFLAQQLVAVVQEAKAKNQLIFASHNANLVVHGDSEVIHVMDSQERPDGRVACALLLSETIDQSNVCAKVEQVMEGGRDAFESRRRKYHETISG